MHFMGLYGRNFGRLWVFRYIVGVILVHFGGLGAFCGIFGTFQMVLLHFWWVLWSGGGGG